MDPIDEWTQSQQRVIALVEDLSAEQAATVVPATPAWTVHDLLAHMIGLDADVVAGDEPDDHNDAWTQRQVDARAEHDIAALLDEWRGLTEPITAWMAANNGRPMGDVLIHEQDLRGALGVSGAQDTDGMLAMRERMVGGFADAVRELPPIAFVGDRWTWLSRGELAGAQTLLRASDFDLTRALMSRRSERQLRSWTERGDVGPYLDAFRALGDLPTADLHE
ncbi:maleylpyruvate isomerase N-terminal domain-containing protein [uncultured Jatrophihabitans sp.]|uniref:maleylpyruvate isomerase N-terminal domain-containing protein n=1 Tax=uncultured Jatrophihabitans sp. TaxID=1610747 RepID=UPI0035CAE1F9